MCLDCRYTNRTGVACQICGKVTARVDRAPKQNDDKGWDALRKKVERWRKLGYVWREENEQTKQFDFSRHLREKNARYEYFSVRKPIIEKRNNKPCSHRRCHVNRPCHRCQARMVEAALGR